MKYIVLNSVAGESSSGKHFDFHPSDDPIEIEDESVAKDLLSAGHIKKLEEKKERKTK